MTTDDTPPLQFVHTDDTVVLRDLTVSSGDPANTPVGDEVWVLGSWFLPDLPVSDKPTTWDTLPYEELTAWNRIGRHSDIDAIAAMPWEVALAFVGADAEIMAGFRAARVIEPVREPIFAELVHEHVALVLDIGEPQTPEWLADWWVECGLINPDHEHAQVAHWFDSDLYHIAATDTDPKDDSAPSEPDHTDNPTDPSTSSDDPTEEQLGEGDDDLLEGRA